MPKHDPSSDRPYWLDGAEICAFCQQHYVLEAEYRCLACDAATCQWCVADDTGEIFCSQCAAEQAE